MSLDPSSPSSTPPVPTPDLTPPPPATVPAQPDPYVPPAAPQAAAGGDNTVAFLAYLTLVGFIIAVVINKDEKKNRLGAFHLRQSLGLLILLIGTSVVFNILALALSKVPVVGLLITGLSLIIYLGLFVLWLLGLLAALGRQEKPVPVIGPIIQDKLKGVFAS